jgi:hypothetical protein
VAIVFSSEVFGLRGRDKAVERVLAFTCGIGLVTVLLFGLLPALSSLRFDVMARLRDAARGSTAERRRIGQVLVTVAVALALMLLAVAGLTFKNLVRLQSQYLGFRAEGVLRAMIDFPPPVTAAWSRKLHFFAKSSAGSATFRV